MTKALIGPRWLAFEALSLFPDIQHIEINAPQGSVHEAWTHDGHDVKPVVLNIGPHPWWEYASVDAVSDALAIILKAECWIPA